MPYFLCIGYRRSIREDSLPFIAQEQRQDCNRAGANVHLKINQWMVSNFKHKKSIYRGLSLLRDRISDH